MVFVSKVTSQNNLILRFLDAIEVPAVREAIIREANTYKITKKNKQMVGDSKTLKTLVESLIKKKCKPRSTPWTCVKKHIFDVRGGDDAMYSFTMDVNVDDAENVLWLKAVLKRIREFVEVSRSQRNTAGSKTPYAEITHLAKVSMERDKGDANLKKIQTIEHIWATSVYLHSDRAKIVDNLRTAKLNQHLASQDILYSNPTQAAVMKMAREYLALEKPTMIQNGTGCFALIAACGRRKSACLSKGIVFQDYVTACKLGLITPTDGMKFTMGFTDVSSVEVKKDLMELNFKTRNLLVVKGDIKAYARTGINQYLPEDHDAVNDENNAKEWQGKYQSAGTTIIPLVFLDAETVLKLVTKLRANVFVDMGINSREYLKELGKKLTTREFAEVFSAEPFLSLRARAVAEERVMGSHLGRKIYIQASYKQFKPKIEACMGSSIQKSYFIQTFLGHTTSAIAVNYDTLDLRDELVPHEALMKSDPALIANAILKIEDQKLELAELQTTVKTLKNIDKVRELVVDAVQDTERAERYVATTVAQRDQHIRVRLYFHAMRLGHNPPHTFSWETASTSAGKSAGMGHGPFKKFQNRCIATNTPMLPPGFVPTNREQIRWAKNCGGKLLGDKITAIQEATTIVNNAQIKRSLEDCDLEIENLKKQKK